MPEIESTLTHEFCTQNKALDGLVAAVDLFIAVGRADRALGPGLKSVEPFGIPAAWPSEHRLLRVPASILRNSRLPGRNIDLHQRRTASDLPTVNLEPDLSVRHRSGRPMEPMA